MLEILMVIIVLGILVSVALPSYEKMLEQGYLRQSEDVVQNIYDGQRAHWLESDTYVDSPVGMAGWRVLHVDDPNLMSGLPVTFTVTASGSEDAATFTATATRDAAGPCPGDQHTLNHLRAESGSWATCVGAL